MSRKEILVLIESRLSSRLELDTPLRELALDSLDYVDLKNYLEEQTGHDVPWDEWTRSTRVLDLLDLFAEDV